MCTPSKSTTTVTLERELAGTANAYRALTVAPAFRCPGEVGHLGLFDVDRVDRLARLVQHRDDDGVQRKVLLASVLDLEIEDRVGAAREASGPSLVSLPNFTSAIRSWTPSE